MLNTDPVTIDAFVQQNLSHPRVNALIANWRIEPDTIWRLLVTQLRDMGIFHVRPEHAPLMLDTLMHHLRYSPEITAMVRKAEAEEQMRKRSRHAE